MGMMGYDFENMGLVPSGNDNLGVLWHKVTGKRSWSLEAVLDIKFKVRVYPGGTKTVFE